MRLLWTCLFLVGLCAPAVARERLFESAERWSATSITSAVRASCVGLGYSDELNCRCAFNAGLVPENGRLPACLEQYACEWLNQEDCEGCDAASDGQFTCRGLVRSRNLRRGYIIASLVLFGLLFLVGIFARAYSSRHPLKPASKSPNPAYYPHAVAFPQQESAADLSWMGVIRNWQWTFWLIFTIPAWVLFGAVFSVIIFGGEGCFFGSNLKMPRWDHHADAIRMPNGDYEEDWAMPTVSNTPEMYVQCSTQIRWVFSDEYSRVNVAEILHLVLLLPAVLFIFAAHTLVAYCRLVLRSRGTWPLLFYLVAIGLIAGLVGIANVQGAYGKEATDAHFILGIVYFACSFLLEFLVVITASNMTTHWAPRWRSALLLAILAIVFRTGYVVMYFIDFSNGPDTHLIIYSTQNLLTWLFTFFQLWMVHSFPRASIDNPQPPPPRRQPQAAPVPAPRPSLPPPPHWHPPAEPLPSRQPIQESAKMVPVFLPDSHIPPLDAPRDTLWPAHSGLPAVPWEHEPLSQASLVHAATWDQDGFVHVDAGLPPPPMLDGAWGSPFLTETLAPDPTYRETAHEPPAGWEPPRYDHGSQFSGNGKVQRWC